MTPTEVDGIPIEVHPIDEYVHSNLRFPRQRTLVALVGVQSHQFHRALDLAAFTKKHGSMVVIGGPHMMTCGTTQMQG